jgi:hypothetical protein
MASNASRSTSTTGQQKPCIVHAASSTIRPFGTSNNQHNAHVMPRYALPPLHSTLLHKPSIAHRPLCLTSSLLSWTFWAAGVALYTYAVALFVRGLTPPCESDTSLSGSVSRVEYREIDSCDPIRWALWHTTPDHVMKSEPLSPIERKYGNTDTAVTNSTFPDYRRGHNETKVSNTTKIKKLERVLPQATLSPELNSSSTSNRSMAHRNHTRLASPKANDGHSRSTVSDSRPRQKISNTTSTVVAATVLDALANSTTSNALGVVAANKAPADQT